MTDSNPFDDLDQSGKNNTDEGSEVVGQTSVESSREQLQTSASSQEEEKETEVSGPAFEYSDVRQRPLYARNETWDEFEDMVGISVVPELRKQGVRDEEKREIHDAVLTLAVEEPDRLVEIILERRKES